MGFEFLSRHDLSGRGATMQLMSWGHHLYVGNMEPGVGTAILDVADPRRPELEGFLPGYRNTMSPKVQIADDLLFVNYEWRKGEKAERTGFGIFDLSDPVEPRELAFYDTGGRGVHRMWYSGLEPTIFMSAVLPGFRDRMFLMVDVSDPTNPREIGRWWLPGQWEEGGETPAWRDDVSPKLHHGIVRGDRAYLGVWDAGLRILDIADPGRPRVVGSAEWAPEHGGHTHTTMPLPERGLLVVTDEATATPDRESPKLVRLFDIRDEANPVQLSTLPEPQGPVRTHGPRFGPHNLHENRPGAFASDQLVFVTYFSGGLRAYDISDPHAPREVAAHVPPSTPDGGHPQTNDVYVEPDGLVFTTDRGGAGIEILQYEV
ncbi:MAG TPA: hypothetical protein VKB31_03725 [Trueperaceae bacterium]|nr:hypothetical protein [Trueperaceae bacterium]